MASDTTLFMNDTVDNISNILIGPAISIGRIDNAIQQSQIDDYFHRISETVTMWQSTKSTYLQSDINVVFMKHIKNIIDNRITLSQAEQIFQAVSEDQKEEAQKQLDLAIILNKVAENTITQDEMNMLMATYWEKYEGNFDRNEDGTYSLVPMVVLHEPADAVMKMFYLRTTKNRLVTKEFVNEDGTTVQFPVYKHIFPPEETLAVNKISYDTEYSITNTGVQIANEVHKKWFGSMKVHVEIMRTKLDKETFKAN